jgi:hypothetical protein
MKYKTAFRLALRAIAILIIAQSLPESIVTIVSLVVSGFTGSSVPSPGGGYLIWVLRSSFVAIIGLVIGLYLFFGGDWIVNRVIPSNRPYGHECAYELTGLPAESNCPECGTPYRRST